MDYKKILQSQHILNYNIITIVEGLQNGSMTKTQFHNKKAYARRSGDLLCLVECAIAFEIVSIGGLNYD